MGWNKLMIDNPTEVQKYKSKSIHLTITLFIVWKFQGFIQSKNYSINNYHNGLKISGVHKNLWIDNYRGLEIPVFDKNLRKYN